MFNTIQKYFKSFFQKKNTKPAIAGVIGIAVSIVVLNSFSDGSLLSSSDNSFASVEKNIAFSSRIDGAQGYVIPASGGSGKDGGYSQSSYYRQGGYYRQSGYYRQGNYYRQSSYYRQGSYGGGYSQGSYGYNQGGYGYSQGSYGYSQSSYGGEDVPPPPYIVAIPSLIDSGDTTTIYWDPNELTNCTINNEHGDSALNSFAIAEAGNESTIEIFGDVTYTLDCAEDSLEAEVRIREDIEEF